MEIETKVVIKRKQDMETGGYCPARRRRAAFKVKRKERKAKPKSEKVKYPVRMRMELKLSEKHFFSIFFFSLNFLSF